MSDEEIGFTKLQTFMIDLADCLCNELGDTCWCGIWPGDEVSWEGCQCDEGCGQGWVRLVGTFPYETFPVPTPDISCRLPHAYAIEVGALRCMPVADTDGSVPSPETLAITAMIQYRDMNALYRALKCCDVPQISVEAYTPVGPDGGCVGGGWTAYVSFE